MYVPSHFTSPRQLIHTAPDPDRYKKMVYDFLANHCGPQFVESLPQTSYHQPRFPSPSVDTFYSTSSAQMNSVNIYSPETYATGGPAGPSGLEGMPMGQHPDAYAQQTHLV